jgi:hypothetical protein
MVCPLVGNEMGKTRLSLPQKSAAGTASDTAGSTVYQRFANEPHGVDVRKIYCGFRIHTLSPGDFSWEHPTCC